MGAIKFMRDEFNQFVSPKKYALVTARKAKADNDAALVEIDAAEQALYDLDAQRVLHPELESDRDIAAELAALRVRKELHLARAPRFARELEAAEDAEANRLHAEELEEHKRIARTRRASLAQHHGEISRRLKTIPEHLAAIHEALVLAQQEAEIAAQNTGHPQLNFDSILGHALLAAGVREDFDAALAQLNAEHI